MAELSIVYEVIGPDGTRAVVGNCDAALADPDYVGSLDPDNGITGLLDAPATRITTTDRVEADGGDAGPGYAGSRPGTLQGLLRPDYPEAAEAAFAKLKRATRALRADGILRWTPTGSSAPRMLRFRRQAGPTPGGRRPKTWQVSLWSGDPYVVAATESSVDLTPGAGGGGELGFTDPITDPITSDLNPLAASLITNDGDAPASPRFRVNGPITNPELVNYTADGAPRIILDTTLAAGEYLDVYPALGAVLLTTAPGADPVDRYGDVDHARTQWWRLEPGANDVRLESDAGTGLTTVYWRHAWE